MTNIINNQTPTDVHSHKEALLFLEAYLGRGYRAEAQSRLERLGITMSTTMIRNIKIGETIDWKVLEVLAEMALENKRAKEKVSELINH
jgi:glutamyl/glutaminyl-tRNA synthetase